MPAVASLTNNDSTEAFEVPTGAIGFVLWNTSAAALRVRFYGKAAAASGDNEGIPLPAGSASDPKYLTHYFDKPLERVMKIQIFQASGGAITSGVGYEILTR